MKTSDPNVCGHEPAVEIYSIPPIVYTPKLKLIIKAWNLNIYSLDPNLPLIKQQCDYNFSSELCMKCRYQLGGTSKNPVSVLKIPW